MNLALGPPSGAFPRAGSHTHIFVCACCLFQVSCYCTDFIAITNTRLSESLRADPAQSVDMLKSQQPPLQLLCFIASPSGKVAPAAVTFAGRSDQFGGFHRSSQRPVAKAASSVRSAACLRAFKHRGSLELEIL